MDMRFARCRHEWSIVPRWDRRGRQERQMRRFGRREQNHRRAVGADEPGTATGYFIECMLYNVPNKLFLNIDGGAGLTDVFNKVINYLLHCDLEKFICQNHVWQLFADANEFWNVRHAGDYLGAIVHLYNIFPPNREFLA